jgi:hypothetical protein
MNVVHEPRELRRSVWSANSSVCRCRSSRSNGPLGPGTTLLDDSLRATVGPADDRGDPRANCRGPVGGAGERRHQQDLSLFDGERTDPARGLVGRNRPNFLLVPMKPSGTTLGAKRRPERKFARRAELARVSQSDSFATNKIEPFTGASALGEARTNDWRSYEGTRAGGEARRDPVSARV